VIFSVTGFLDSECFMIGFRFTTGVESEYFMIGFW
jgi:hypothetical protein